MKPNLSEEKKMWKKRIKWVVCLDESGRGSLAGPVVAAATMLKNPKFQIPLIAKQLQGAERLVRISKQIPKIKIRNSEQKGSGHLTAEILNLFKICNLELGISRFRDSKKLSAKRREELYKILTTHPVIEWGIGKVSERIVDRINIFEATKLAMKRAIKDLERKSQKPKFQKTYDRRFFGKIDFLIIDGNFKIDLSIPQKSIVKADEKIFSCSLASIIAKVTRDKIMQRYQKKYPQYGFGKHKGYGTKQHLEMLKKFGPCRIHRQSFKPVAEMKMQKDKK